MFPRPIQKSSTAAQWIYTFALPVALLIWLFPLLGVALTSLRPASDLAQGNYFGMPSGIAWENYVYIFTETPIGQYMVNSLWVTIPTVIGAVG
ncbi:MAG: carbohydrate ABC transporter permease, partial [Paracoccaceae bacterium]